jgi:hemolysin D
VSLVTVPLSRRGAVPAAPPSAPAPRALIDYDFQSVMTVPPKRRLVLWLMVGLIVVAAVMLAVLKVDIVVSANGKIVTGDSEIVIQPLETSVVRSIASCPWLAIVQASAMRVRPRLSPSARRLAIRTRGLATDSPLRR